MRVLCPRVTVPGVVFFERARVPRLVWVLPRVRLPVVVLLVLLAYDYFGGVNVGVL